MISLEQQVGSCTPTLRLIPPIQKSDTMAPSNTSMRGRCDDSAPYLRPAGDCGTPVALRYAALRVAKPRRGVTATPRAIRASAGEAQAIQGAQTLCGAHPTTALRPVRTRDQPSRAAASKTPCPHGAAHPPPSCQRHLQAFLPACGL